MPIFWFSLCPSTSIGDHCLYIVAIIGATGVAPSYRKKTFPNGPRFLLWHPDWMVWQEIGIAYNCVLSEGVLVEPTMLT